MNALTVEYAVNYEKEGFSFIALCPGVSLSSDNSFAFPLITRA